MKLRIFMEMTNCANYVCNSRANYVCNSREVMRRHLVPTCIFGGGVLGVTCYLEAKQHRKNYRDVVANLVVNSNISTESELVTLCHQFYLNYDDKSIELMKSRLEESRIVDEVDVDVARFSQNVPETLQRLAKKRAYQVEYYYPRCKIDVKTECDRDWPTMAKDCNCVTTYTITKKT